MAKILSLNRLRKSPARLPIDTDKQQKVNEVEQEILKVLQSNNSSGELTLLSNIKSSAKEETNNKNSNIEDPKKLDNKETKNSNIEEPKKLDNNENKTSNIEEPKKSTKEKVNNSLSNNIIPAIKDENDIWNITDFCKALSDVLIVEEESEVDVHKLKWHNKVALNLINEITQLLNETYENDYNIYVKTSAIITSNRIKWTNLPALFQKNNKLNCYQSMTISDNTQLSLLPTLRINCLKVKLNLYHNDKNLPLDILTTICSNLRKYDIYIDTITIVINACSLIDFFVKLTLTKLILMRKIYIESFNEYYFSFLIFIEDGYDNTNNITTDGSFTEDVL